MKRTPLRAQSAKKRKQDGQRRKLTERFLAEHHVCQAMLGGCQGRVDDVHEIIQRSVMPSAAVDDRLYLGLCRHCHSQISDKFGWAWNHGYVLKSWQMTPEWFDVADRLRRMHCSRSTRCTTMHMGMTVDAIFEDNDD